MTATSEYLNREPRELADVLAERGRRVTHRKAPRNRGHYACPHCGRRFLYPIAILHHRRDKHGDPA